MGDYENVRGALGEGALRMKYVMLALGLVPIFFLILEVVLQFAIPSENLAEPRDATPGVLIAIVCAIVAIGAVTVVPRLIYSTAVKKGSSPQNVGIIIIYLALALTPSDLGLVLFFLTNIWVSIPFHLLALFCVWRFNLNIEKFLDGMARDITGETA